MTVPVTQRCRRLLCRHPPKLIHSINPHVSDKRWMVMTKLSIIKVLAKPGHVKTADGGCFKLELDAPALFNDVITLSFEVALPKNCSEASVCWLFSLLLGLAQILISPSRHMVRIDSLVNSRPERGSTCTRWATRGESFGTSRIRGEGWRTPVGGHALSQCVEGLPLLNVGEPAEGWRRGTESSSIARSQRSSRVSYNHAKWICINTSTELVGIAGKAYITGQAVHPKSLLMYDHKIPWYIQNYLGKEKVIGRPTSTQLK